MRLSSKQLSKIRQYLTGVPVNRAYVFGSYSRDDANPQSDVDILVELDHREPIGLRFFVYQDELSNILKKKVDLISEEGLSSFVKPFVDHDKVLIYEKPVGGIKSDCNIYCRLFHK